MGRGLGREFMAGCVARLNLAGVGVGHRPNLHIRVATHRVLGVASCLPQIAHNLNLGAASVTGRVATATTCCRYPGR